MEFITWLPLSHPKHVLHKVGAEAADPLGEHRPGALVKVVQLDHAALADKDLIPNLH